VRITFLTIFKLPYYDVLVDFPFKGDEAALRSMEHSELISITTQDGKPLGIAMTLSHFPQADRLQYDQEDLYIAMYSKGLSMVSL
jgi:hypothetical protein